MPSIKSTIQRGSAIVRGFKTRIIAELEAATTKSDPGLTDIKVPPFQQLGVKLLMDGYPKAFIGNLTPKNGNAMRDLLITELSH